MFITKKLLEKLDACKEGINFFNAYFPDGVDTDKIKVTGDYNDYWYFIKNLPEIKVDNNGNVIWKKYPDGDIWEAKYDDNNNIIWEKYPSGRIYEYKYDDNGNKIWEKYPCGRITEWEYKYDDNNNMIWEKDPNGSIWRWSFTVGENNRLKEITRNNKVICTIEYLD
jgi:YD repeat-containing protein